MNFYQFYDVKYNTFKMVLFVFSFEVGSYIPDPVFCKEIVNRRTPVTLVPTVLSEEIPLERLPVFFSLLT